MDKPRERPNALGQRDQQAQSIQGHAGTVRRRLPGNAASQGGPPVVPGYPDYTLPQSRPHTPGGGETRWGVSLEPDIPGWRAGGGGRVL